MANSLGTNPIIIDTTLVTAFNASQSTASTRKPLRVRKIEWFNPAATTDTFSITENVSGKKLLEGKCEVAAQSQIFDFASKALILPQTSDWKATITSGTLYIWYQ